MSRQPVYPPQGACPPGAQQCPYPSTPQSGYSTYPSTPQYGYARAQASGYPGAGSAPFCGTNAQQGFMPKPSKGGVPKEQCSGRLDLGISPDDDQGLDLLAIENFQQYLQIPSVQPDVKYGHCINFLRKQADSVKLPSLLYQVENAKPVLVITWTGTVPSLPSIMLNSHMDVVSVCEDSWTHDPFGGVIEDGKIYGRGAQDMKSVGIQYLEAIRRLKLRGWSFRRTIHLVYVPDEEIGGVEGLKKFTSSKEFRKLNVGFALDEGMPNDGEEFFIFNAERAAWQFTYHCQAVPGHGSLQLQGSAGEKIAYVVGKLYERRRQEEKKFLSNAYMPLGYVMSINLTELSGGMAMNVAPSELSATFDCRLPLTEDVRKWKETLYEWAKEAGDGVKLEFKRADKLVPPTRLDESNPFWMAFKEGLDELDIKVKKAVFPAATDGRYLRMKKIPVIGFSPINNTENLMHANDEYLGVNTFLIGIEIYCKLISNIASV